MIPDNCIPFWIGNGLEPFFLSLDVPVETRLVDTKCLAILASSLFDEVILLDIKDLVDDVNLARILELQLRFRGDLR